ncbi:MAG: hypothetical protein HY395_02750 [Candidatus Doudnabacteria bacterium]|nr:hypothetical protein [Candidatus Doudnabacteria bacterium]
MAEVVPAILTNDVSDFRKKHAELFAASHLFSKLHIDFADGEFVRNTTLKPGDLLFLKSPFALAAHFMTFHPENYFSDASKAGFKTAIVHFEAFNDLQALNEALDQAEQQKLQPGLAVNPETPLVKVGGILSRVSLVQLMGIHPGYQGQKFMASTVEKIKELRSLSKNVIIAVDGGVKVGIARQCVKAGADMIISGSAIFRSEDAEMAIEALKADIET